MFAIARPPKVGLDYFPLDVDFFNDEKIELVSARFGTKGEAITIRLLCKIYRNGYFTEWNEDTTLLLAKGVGDGCQDSCVRDVVHELLRRGFFDRSISSRFGVLTSKGIQRRFLLAVKERSVVELNPDYWLIERPSDTKKTKYVFSPGETELSGGKTQLSHGSGTQRKVKNNSLSMRAREDLFPAPSEAAVQAHTRPSKPADDDISRLLALMREKHGAHSADHNALAGIADWVTIIGADMVAYAIVFAKEERTGGSKSWGYVEKILRSWDADGFKNPEAVKAAYAKQNARMNGKRNPALDYEQREYSEGELDYLIDEL